MHRYVFAMVVLVAAGFVACDKNGVDDAPPSESAEAVAVEPSAEEAEPASVAADEVAEAEPVVVVPLEHGSLLLRTKDLVVAIDPVKSALDAAEGDEPQADLILITHQHGDHLDTEAIAKLRKSGADVVTSQRVATEAGEALPAPVVLANGETLAFLAGRVVVEAVPMYNQKRKRENGEFYHPKGMGNGYVVTLAGQRIYISGDTECTPEMAALEDIEMAFVCMNLPYTMIPEEAAECIRDFKPKVLYPYHYRGQDPSKLISLLQDVPEVEVKLLNWYPNGQ